MCECSKRCTEALEVCESLTLTVRTHSRWSSGSSMFNPDANGTYALPLVAGSSMCGFVDLRICGFADVRNGCLEGSFFGI